MALSAERKLSLAARVFRRPLGDHIDHAARLVLAIKHRDRTFEDLHTLQTVRLGRHDAEVAERRVAKAVKIGIGELASDKDVVGRYDGAAIIRAHACAVSQGLVQPVCGLLIDPITRDDRDRLWCLKQGRICLGARRSAGRNNAINRTPWILTGDVDRLQRRRPVNGNTAAHRACLGDRNGPRIGEGVSQSQPARIFAIATSGVARPTMPEVCLAEAMDGT